MKNSPLAPFLRVTLAKFLMLLFRVKVVGASNLPDGAALLAGNHVSYMDPVLLWCATPRPTHFMAKAELWRSAVLAWLLDRLWAFPVAREEADRTAIATATSLLGSGALVAMFPEGTRGTGGDVLGEAHGGAAFIAIRAGVPIVPVAFIGTDEVWPRGRRLPRLARVTIRFGQPVSPQDFPDGSRKERVTAMMREIMRRISAELAEARRP